jgi:hypothetical protein
MSLKKNIIRVWKAKGQILEGITNSIFKREDVEQIAQQRMQVCMNCALLDMQGDGCMVPGTQPCCNQDKGGCGCSLSFKTRSLSSCCPHPEGPKWDAEMTQEEEDQLNLKLGI